MTTYKSSWSCELPTRKRHATARTSPHDRAERDRCCRGAHNFLILGSRALCPAPSRERQRRAFETRRVRFRFQPALPEHPRIVPGLFDCRMALKNMLSALSPGKSSGGFVKACDV